MAKKRDTELEAARKAIRNGMSPPSGFAYNPQMDPSVFRTGQKDAEVSNTDSDAAAAKNDAQAADFEEE